MGNRMILAFEFAEARKANSAGEGLLHGLYYGRLDGAQAL